MTTALQLITRAMQKAGVLFKTEAPSADEANDALSDLNNMIASWSNSTNVVYALTTETFNLVGGQREYTWGTGGDFNSARPIQIVTATLNYPAGVSLPMEMITDENYALIQMKTTQGVPQVINVSNEYPLNTLAFYPVPSTNYTATFQSEKAVSSIASLYTTISLPPGWEHALIHNLAVLLAPEYGVEAPAAVQAEAVKSKGEIMLQVAKARPLDWPGDVVQQGNVFNGWFS